MKYFEFDNDLCFEGRRYLKLLLLMILPAAMLCGCIDTPVVTKTRKQRPRVFPTDGAESISESQADLLQRENALFPLGQWLVDVMEIDASKRQEELLLRFRVALSENQEWFIKQISQLGPAKPLPYHENVGLSESEYEELFSFFENATLKKVGEALVTIERRDAHTYLINGDKSLPEFKEFEVDVKGDVVRTPYGNARMRTEVDANDESAFGAWTGTKWKTQEVNLDSHTARRVELAIGTVKASGQRLLYYDIKDVSPAHRASCLRVLMFHSSSME